MPSFEPNIRNDAAIVLAEHLGGKPRDHCRRLEPGEVTIRLAITLSNVDNLRSLPDVLVVPVTNRKRTFSQIDYFLKNS